MRVDRIGGPAARPAPVPAIRRPSKPRREDEREPEDDAPADARDADGPGRSAGAPRPRLDVLA